MSDKFKNIFSTTLCVSTTELKRYINNDISNREKHLIEKHLLSCQICSDELDGLIFIKEQSISSKNINKLNILIEKKINSNNTNTIYIKIAASIIGIILVSWLIKIYFDSDKISINKILSSSEITKEKLINQEEILSKEINESEKNEIPKIIDEKVANDYFVDKKLEKQTGEIIEKDKIIHDRVTTGSSAGSINVENDKDDENNYKVTVEQKLNPTTSSSKKSDLAKSYENQTILDSNIPISLNEDTDIYTDDLSSIVTLANKDENKKTNNSISRANKAKNNKEETSQLPSLEKTILLTESIVGSKDNDTTYEKAVNYYNLQKYENSIIEFSKIVLNPNNKNYYNALWYKAQSYIKLSMLDEAKKILKLIEKDSKNPYSNDAKNLLKSL